MKKGSATAMLASVATMPSRTPNRKLTSSTAGKKVTNGEPTGSTGRSTSRSRKASRTMPATNA